VFSVVKDIQMKLYGIPNCGTVKKARVFLEARGINYDFHDFKKQGVSEALIAGWLKQVGWQKLLKKTGPTWGQLPDEVKAGIKDDASALALMLEKPNVIKRPVLEQNGKIIATGFTEADYESLLK
jgi:arsenate reductase (glutaredoxin)